MGNKAVKIRNPKAESRSLFLINLFVLLIIAAVLWMALPTTGNIGVRNMFFMNVIFAVAAMSFMAALEKYSVTVSGFSEKVIINVLSGVYSFVVMCVINMAFFMNRGRLLADAVYLIAAVVFLSIFDKLFEKYVTNPNKFKKPKLLIISSSDKSFMRMKRIKYGTLMSAYDSWYENLDGISESEFMDFISERFREVDAICMLDGLAENEYNAAVKMAVGLQKELFIVPNIIDVGKTNAEFIRFDDIPALYMPKHYITKAEFAIKRIADLVISSIGLVIAAIPMLIIAAAVKLTSPGPIFYKQERLTKDKKHFMIYKFRTMVPDAEKLTGPKFAEKDDPRITKVGKLLRACRLDELPQLLNILKGDMSVVGPRPERAIFTEQFEKEIEHYNYRFAVKAGLTSLSHVYGRYSTYIHDRTYYDLFYITNYSFLLDLKIILLTTKTMFVKSAAEGEDDFKEKTSAASEENNFAEKTSV